MKANYPIITDTDITWSKEALEAIEATKTEPCNMIAELVITMEAAKEADQRFVYSADCGLSPEEFFESDLFVNSPQRQLTIVNYVLERYLQW